MSVRAKMKCEAIETYQDGIGGSVTLYPVTDGSKENKDFYRWTPGGQLLLSTINQKAIDQFEVGKEFYVDITEVNQ